MSQHPAAEIVAIALRKIQKVANRKTHQALLDECQAFLDGLHLIFPGPDGRLALLLPPAVPAPGSSDAAALPPPSPTPGTPPAAEPSPTAGEDAAPSPVGDSAPAAAVTPAAATPTASAPGTPTAAEVKAHFAAEDLAEAKTATESSLGAVPAASAASATAPPLPDLVPRTETALPDATTLRVVHLMRAAVLTERPPIMEAALDCIQKLIAFKFLQGAVYSIRLDKAPTPGEDKPDVSEDDPSTKTPQAQAVELLCRCDEVPDEGVELAVLKGLLTAATAPTFTVHGQALLLAVRTCYNIHLMSRTEVNQTTAKATLTQMLNVVFQRMEADDIAVEVKPIVLAEVMSLTRSTLLQDAAAAVVSNVQSFLNNVVMVAGPTMGVAPSSSERTRASVAGAFLAERPSFTPPAAAAPPAAPSPPPPPVPRTETEGGRQALVLEPLYHTPEQVARSAVLQKDAYMVFRALCKLSIRAADGATGNDASGVRGKVLALELLKVLLENSGPTFRRSETFIGAIRQYLCVSLLKNTASSVPAALQLSCSILLSLLSKFRTHLKAEIGVFFPMMLLKPFEPAQGPGGGVAGPVVGAASLAQAPSAPPSPAIVAYRAAVLRVMGEVCRDGQLLVDLFVNYDCDIDSSSLFERMVNVLVRVAQQPPVSQPPSAVMVDSGNAYAAEAALRLDALQALVNLVEAMLHWHKLTVNLVEVDLSSPSSFGRAGAAAAGDGGDAGTDGNASSANLRELGEAGEGAGVPVHTSTTAGGALPDGASDDLNARRAFKAKFQECIALFNKKPKRGIAALQQEGMLGTEVQDVAQFLARTKGLDKTTIGDYLGEREPFNLKVMHAYVDALDFSGLELDGAIRLFLSGFRLPGEAQKIDRLMEKFAERFMRCNPGAYKSADVAYILAFSVIMLNTDLHNPQVKNKMTKEGFIKNNRGINDGQDLPREYLDALYDRIAHHEIKMKEDGGALEVDPQGAGSQARTMFTTLLSLMGAFKEEKHTEPSEESIKRTLDYLHDKAKGSLSVTVSEPEAVRPMMEVIWAPLLGALSVLFDEYFDIRPITICLQGISASCCLTALVGMTALRDVFIHSLCGFTHLHSPQTMRIKNALAFQFLLRVASPDNVGNQLDDRWVDVLRCVSRWELLQQIASGIPTDAALFAQAQERGVKAVLKKVFKDDDSISTSSLRSIDSLAMSEASIKKQLHGSSGGAAAAKRGADEVAIASELVNSFDVRELHALFTGSSQLNSESVVAFVRALCTVSYDELESARTPRIFSMARLVEVAHFNMTRIRLVWSRIWAVLSDYFIHVGCHANLQVAMYAVDSLRQLAMKFLERDELANYTFQNDFLRPFVVVMRQSQAVEIRELIIRCLSQMVLARVDNVKSGWKSMFMVFTTAAGDKEQMIVNLAFDTIEKIVREHFSHITETETTTFTDCVNCLIAFTNNPHSSTVALNSIAFLRYCAVKLAEGAIGDVNEGLPEGVAPPTTQSALRVVALDAVAEPTTPTIQHPIVQEDRPSAVAQRFAAGRHVRHGSATGGPLSLQKDPSSLRFVDRDEHVYFWFPLLAGLSELTFDPRDQIRNSALEVLFDTLKTHGGSFAASFWRRVFDSVLMPIFDHVRAEVTDTTTFTSEKRREKEDFWLFETCKRCLQHLIDVFVLFYDETAGLLPQLLQLLTSFVNRSHQSLAAGGVYALMRLVTTAAPRLQPAAWNTVSAYLLSVAQETAPNARDLVTPPARHGPPTPAAGAAANGHGGGGHDGPDASLGQGPGNAPPAPPRTPQHGPSSGFTLREGIGARRLARFRTQSHVQLLLVQGCSQVYASQHHLMPASAVNTLLDALELMATHARAVDADTVLRKRLALQQAEDKVPDDRVVYDPPLLRLETEAAHAYLSVLLHLLAYAPGGQAKAACNAPARITALCLAILSRYSAGSDRSRIQPDAQYMSEATVKLAQLQATGTSRASGEGGRPATPPPPAGGGKGVIRSALQGMQLGGGGTNAEAQRRAAAYAAAVEAATRGRTADQRSIIVGRTTGGVLVLMAAPAVEFGPFAPLIHSTLAALAGLEDSIFKSRLHEFFPLLTALISTDYASADVLRALAGLFATRVGPILGVARAEAAAELANAAAAARAQAEAAAADALAHQQQAARDAQQQEALGLTGVAGGALAADGAPVPIAASS